MLRAALSMSQTITSAPQSKNFFAIAKPKPYWSLEYIAKNAINNIYRGSSNEAIVDLEGLLNSSIQEQMQADVPLGVFLSGGIDSSLIASKTEPSTTSSCPIPTLLPCISKFL